MQAVTVSFIQEEQDIFDSMLHVMRRGSMRRLTLWSPVVVVLFFSALILVSFGTWPGFTFTLAMVGLGLLQLALNWYVVPSSIASRCLVFWELNSQSPGDTAVRFAPEGLTWSGPSAAWTIPWGIVRRVETAPGGICISAGSPSTVLWIPARSFPGRAELEMTARLAETYVAETVRVPVSEMEWPQSRQQRKSALLFGVVYAAPLMLAMLAYLLLK